MSSHYVENIIISDIQLTGKCSGGIAAYIEISDEGKAIIKDVFSSGSVNGTSLIAGGMFGAIRANGKGKVEAIGCNVDVSINSGAYWGDAYAAIGGIVGQAVDNGSGEFIIQDCSVAGDLTTQQSYGYCSSEAGGLIGLLRINKVKIERCCKTGSVSCKAYYAYTGGFIGNTTINGSEMEINNCYVNADILPICTNGASQGGGLIGHTEGSGGSQIRVSNTYVTGNISASNKAAFVCWHGGDECPVISNCYFDMNKLGLGKDSMVCKLASFSTTWLNDNISNSGGLTTEDMKLQSNYVGWDFESIWKMGVDYPVFVWQISDLPEEPEETVGIVSQLPECGYQYCGLDDLTCKIKFDQNIVSCKEDKYVSLVEYDTDKVIEKYDLNGIMDGDNEKAQILNDTLKLKFNVEWSQNGTRLSANTKYYILIDEDAIELNGGNEFGILDKQCWHFTTAPMEYSLKVNPKEKISVDIYNKFYKPLTAWWLSLFHNGTGGTCFGIAYAAGAWDKKYRAISSFEVNGNTIKNFEWTDKGNLSCSFLEYVQLAYIYQHTSSMQKELKRSENQYEILYEKLKEYQNNNGLPIMICVRNYKNSGHAIVPVGIISEDNTSVRIAVYECNGGHEPYDFLDELILEKKNGEIVDWKFHDYNNQDGNKGKIQFFLMNEIIDNAIFYSNYEESYNLIHSKNEIEDLDEIASYADSVVQENYLYWTADNAISRAASSNTELSEIGITDGYKGISINMPLNADVTLNLDSDTAQASFAGMSDYSVTYSKVIDDDIHSITVNGKASGSLLAEQTTEGVVLKADSLKDIAVEVKNNDATVSQKIFSSEKDSVLVKEENNDIIIYEDSNGDGTYDKRINLEIGDATSVYAVAVTVQKDNKIWNEHGRKFALTTDNGVTFVSNLDKVPEGNYVIYDVTGIDENSFGTGGVNTGISVTVKAGDADATVDFYTVTFYDQDIAYGGETFQRPQIILKGKKASVPSFNPTKSGYSFDGWVTTGGGSQTYNFDTSIVGTTNIYASWTQNESVGYTITASAEEGGSITPNGSIHVNEGENQTFTITPDSGYRLKSIIVDGKEEVSDEEKMRESSTQQEGIRHYTFSDVRVNHIIRVVFETDNGNTGDGGNTGGNTGDSGNTGDNTGGNTGDGGNSGNTGGSTGDSGSGGNTGGNGSSSGNNGNTNSSGSNAGDNGSADSNSNNANGSGNTNATDNANNSSFLNSGAGNTTNDGNSTGNNNSNSNNKNNSVSNVSSGNNGINPKTDSSKDTEPRTEDVSHIEIYATIAMITGLLYLVLYFADEGGITEDEKNEIVAALVKWAKQGSWVRKYAALVLIFFLLAYYHSIGKRTSVEWKAVYGK